MPNVCEKHEISGCAICSGQVKDYEESLIDRVPDGRPDPISGGTSIWAQFPGSCGRCGRQYSRGAPIWRAYGDIGIYEGWIGVECCVG